MKSNGFTMPRDNAMMGLNCCAPFFDFLLINIPFRVPLAFMSIVKGYFRIATSGGFLVVLFRDERQVSRRSTLKVLRSKNCAVVLKIFYVTVERKKRVTWSSRWNSWPRVASLPSQSALFENCARTRRRLGITVEQPRARSIDSRTTVANELFPANRNAAPTWIVTFENAIFHSARTDEWFNFISKSVVSAV